MWKVIYGLQIVKEGQEDPFEGKNDGNDGEEEEENEKEEEEEGKKEKEEKNKEEVEKEIVKGDKAIDEEQHQEQSVQDTQLPPPSPPHTTPTPIESVTIKDVPDTSSQKINPLTIDDLKNILHQTTLQSQLCKNLVLVSVEELQKIVVKITKKKVNPQLPPSHTQTTTSGKPQEQAIHVTISKVDSIVIVTTTTEEKDKKKT